MKKAVGLIVLSLAIFLSINIFVSADCPDYCERDSAFFNGIDTRTGCEYTQTPCDYGCDGAVCAPEPTPCEDYCLDDIFYSEGIAGSINECEYTQTPCDYGCDGAVCAGYLDEVPLEENDSVAENILQLEEPKDNETNDPGHETPKENETQVVAPGEIPFTPKKQSGINEEESNPPKSNILDSSLEINDLFIQVRTPEKHFTFQNRIGEVANKYGVNREDVEISEEEGEPTYTFTQIVKIKIFWIFPKSAENKVSINTSSLEKINENLPWWAIFGSKEVTESEIDNFICTKDNDCAKFDSENLCEGTHYCDAKNDVTGKHCKINPATVPECKGQKGECGFDTCNPKNGLCEIVDLPNGTFCNADGNDCTKGDFCSEGSCVKGGWDYDNQEKCQCRTQKDCLEHENGDVCDGTLYCKKPENQCIINPSTIVKCSTSSDNLCNINTCNSKTGKCTLEFTDEKTACDDGNSCTNGDSCSLGTCISGENNTCECEQDADCAKLENGDVCDGTLYCNKLKNKCELNPATVLNCPTVGDTQCEKNTCNKTSGACKMMPANFGENCFLGDDCVIAFCNSDGSCKGEWDFTKIVSENKKCECKENSDCNKLENGDVCDGTLYCDKSTGSCELNPSTIVSCQSVDNTYCEKNTCNNVTGDCEMKPINTGESCYLGFDCIDSYCTLGGNCEGSWNYNKILGGDKKCECKENSDCEALEDGDSCNGTLYCDKQVGTCKINPSTVGNC